MYDRIGVSDYVNRNTGYYWTIVEKKVVYYEFHETDHPWSLCLVGSLSLLLLKFIPSTADHPILLVNYVILVERSRIRTRQTFIADNFTLAGCHEPGREDREQQFG